MEEPQLVFHLIYLVVLLLLLYSRGQIYFGCLCSLDSWSITSFQACVSIRLLSLVFGRLSFNRIWRWWSGSWLGNDTFSLFKSLWVDNWLFEPCFLRFRGNWYRCSRPWAFHDRCSKFSVFKRRRIVEGEFLYFFLFFFWSVWNSVHLNASGWVSSGLGTSFGLLWCPSCRSEIILAKIQSLLSHCLFVFIFLNLLLSWIGSAFGRTSSRFPKWPLVNTVTLSMIYTTILAHLAAIGFGLLHINVTYGLSGLFL